MKALAAALLVVASLALATTTVGRAGNALCEGTLQEWQVKRALGIRGAIRLAVSSSSRKGAYSCTWTYATKTTGKALLYNTVDLRIPGAVEARRSTIADELCHFKVACGTRLRGVRTAKTGSQLFGEIAKAFYRGGKARKVVLGSGAPAFVAVGPGGLTGGAYAYHQGWLDIFACVDTRSYELDPDCSVTAMQLADG
ncbi:MAG: hypothetical protein RMM28_04310 [Thermoleophilia bacterium]|nr:hypothetical protein [Gaiellaceae bacterium]MDW8338345.1 hypothetical protein [Thermoleophilia bacterium]